MTVNDRLTVVEQALARSDTGGWVGQLAITDGFIIKQGSSSSIMSIASEKTAYFKRTVIL